mmetsp:Transcript_26626/g.63095  ORF Transcript_26626/g.63095 Transcript_26626/m.63095 type:complete len:318 (+) Transcript_26626:328-1281(+)
MPSVWPSCGQTLIWQAPAADVAAPPARCRCRPLAPVHDTTASEKQAPRQHGRGGETDGRWIPVVAPWRSVLLGRGLDSGRLGGHLRGPRAALSQSPPLADNCVCQGGKVPPRRARQRRLARGPLEPLQERLLPGQEGRPAAARPGAHRAATSRELCLADAVERLWADARRRRRRFTPICLVAGRRVRPPQPAAPQTVVSLLPAVASGKALCRVELHELDLDLAGRRLAAAGAPGSAAPLRCPVAFEAIEVREGCEGRARGRLEAHQAEVVLAMLSAGRLQPGVPAVPRNNHANPCGHIGPEGELLGRYEESAACKHG